jgi:hypothetical protein
VFVIVAFVSINVHVQVYVGISSSVGVLFVLLTTILPHKLLLTIALDNISICVHVALKICEISHTVSISVQLYALFKFVIKSSLASCHDPVDSDNVFRLQLNTT